MDQVVADVALGLVHGIVVRRAVPLSQGAQQALVQVVVDRAGGVEQFAAQHHQPVDVLGRVGAQSQEALVDARQAFLLALARGDVFAGPNQPDDAAGAVPPRFAAGQRGPGCAVGPPGAKFKFVGCAVADSGLDGHPQPLHVVGVVQFRMLRKGGGGAGGIEPEEAVEFLRPKYRVGGDVPFPASQSGDALGARQAFGGPAEFELAAAHVRNQMGDFRDQVHGMFKFCTAPAGHAVERGEILGLVEAELPRLRAEYLPVHVFVFKEKLAQEQIARLSSVDHEGRGHVPHVVLAAVELEGAGFHAGGEFGVALDAAAAGFGMNAVEFGADVLPAGGCQQVALQIGDGHADAVHGIPGIHDGLNGGQIEQVRQFEGRGAGGIRTGLGLRIRRHETPSRRAAGGPATCYEFISSRCRCRVKALSKKT